MQVPDFDDSLIKCILDSKKFKNRKYICTYKKLGKGAYSKVYRGYIQEDDVEVNEDDDREYIAIKKMKMNQLKARDCLENEIDIMRNLDHKHILKLVDVIEVSDKGENVIYIILEMCGGGDLKHLVRHRRMKEKYAISYFKQIADGLQYLRYRNIIHRDLKPHNVLLTKDRKTLKIADFGFAKIVGSEALAETLCGSPLYMAPEILLKKPYTSKADLWSVGVMLYEVLCGSHPFKSIDSILDLVHKVEKNKIQFPSSANISPYGIDLLKRLLKKNPYERIGWDEFFNHKWFKMLSSSSQIEYPSEKNNSFSGSPQNQTTQLSIATSPIPIIQNYSSNNISRMTAMSPPSFMNSPMFPDNRIALNIIDNYESMNVSTKSEKMQSMPMLPFESQKSRKMSNSVSQNLSQHITGYLGTSFKMFKDSLKSQSFHSMP